MSKIINVLPKQEYCLDIILDNGSSIQLSLKSRLETIRFGALADAELFQKVTTDGICINWDGKVEISLSEAFQLAQK
ncbi:MAG: DUF2442 domain-containing protein [Oscillospiraceae bacterium]